jgi:hypothetical protein
MASFAVEFFDTGRSGDGYGKIHKTGCRDLRDPELLGDAEDRAQLLDLFNDVTGWGYDEPSELELSPCADRLLPKRR